MVAKENYGHSLYEVYRSIEGNPKYERLKNLMSEAQKKLYGMSNDLSKSGKFPDISPFGATYKPYGEVIRADVRAAMVDINLAYNENVIDEKTYNHFQNLLEKIG